MNKKALWITLLVLLAVIGVAATLYPKLSAGMTPQQLATTPAAEATEPATEATEPETTQATEATEPETLQATEAPTEEPTEPPIVPAPDITLQDWDGNEVKLSDYFGKPLVLNFWAHWCGPCQMEMPVFQSFHEELGDEVTFLMTHVGVAVDKGKETVNDAGYTFPVVFDTKDMADMAYGVNAYPTTFFVDAEGNLQAYYIGVMDAELLQQGIDMIYTEE